MYWPNESAHFQQLGGRMAFENMLRTGLISHLHIYSYRVERVKYASQPEFEQAALEEVRRTRPDILFVQHVVGTDLRETLWRRVCAEFPGASIVYHEGDPFDTRVKRVDAATIEMLRHSDQVYACGLGSLADILGRHAKAPISYMAHCFDTQRFGQGDPRATEKRHDIVMIANRGRRQRLKHLYVPGGRRRAEVATRLSEVWGKRFALYGSGWENLEAGRGRLPFEEQEIAIQSGRISANWDHFDKIDYYFSDRLPISLAAGVPHVTTWHVGYDHLFADTPGLYACKTVDEVVETCRWLLSRTDEDLMAEGLAAKQWAFANMDAIRTFTTCMTRALALHAEKIAA